jgi:glycosyltransferase involved in cell wall biosynthesis
MLDTSMNEVTLATLSAIVHVCNEAHLLTDCLESSKWADEIVVVDMHSTDGSEQVYHRYTDRVFLHPREIITDRAHNFGFSHTRGDWLLKLNPDERVSPACPGCSP